MINLLLALLSIFGFLLDNALAWSCARSSWLYQRRNPNPVISSVGKLTSLSSSSSSSSNNIVLRPSEDPVAFDSYKIGSPRVHRYFSRQNNPDEPLYVMWYHGRSRNVSDAEATSSLPLPPLSTGRIGRAISNNGLAWEKDLLGSASEDVPAVSLGLNKESWWGFDTTHVGLGQVLLPMRTPAIRTDSGVYLMYFFGGNYEESPIGDFLSSAGPNSDVKMQGMKMRIGVAISQDGVTFGRVEGDDPTGACISPYDANDPNMKAIATMRDDNDSKLIIEEELYCGWPEVVSTAEDEDDEEDNNASKLRSSKKKKMSADIKFLMYYSTMEKATKQKSIACAVSPDGFRWLKRGVCLRPSSDEDALDNGGCARCCVVRKALYDPSSRKWKSLEGWQMYYEGVSPRDGKHRILLAESDDDGRLWQKKGLALDVGESDGLWDCAGVGSPHILR